MKEPRYVAATLKWCNAKRKLKGNSPLDKLPKGIRCDAYSCPCGKAAGVCVGTQSWWGDDGMIGALPISVVQFAHDFDIGLLPQYEQKGKKQ